MNAAPSLSKPPTPLVVAPHPEIPRQSPKCPPKPNKDKDKDKLGRDKQANSPKTGGDKTTGLGAATLEGSGAQIEQAK